MGFLSWLKKKASTPKADSYFANVSFDVHGCFNPADQTKQSDIYRRNGNTFLSEGKLDDASASYLLAIAVNPQDADAYLNLGFVLSEQQRYKEAEYSLRKSLDINPKLADAFYILGLIAKAQNNMADAIENFAEAINIKPDFEVVYGDLCQILFKNGQAERAKEVILKGISIYPRAADFYFYLGNLYIDRKSVV